MAKTSSAGVTVTSVNGQQGDVTLDTDDIDEGSTNLYYTNTRVLNAMSGLYEVPLTFSNGLTRSTNDIKNDFNNR